MAWLMKFLFIKDSFQRFCIGENYRNFNL